MKEKFLGYTLSEVGEDAVLLSPWGTEELQYKKTNFNKAKKSLFDILPFKPIKLVKEIEETEVNFFEADFKAFGRMWRGLFSADEYVCEDRFLDEYYPITEDGEHDGDEDNCEFPEMMSSLAMDILYRNWDKFIYEDFTPALKELREQEQTDRLHNESLRIPR